MKFLHHKNGVTSAYHTSSDWWAIYGYRTDHMTNFTLTAKKSHWCTLMHAREGTTIFTSMLKSSYPVLSHLLHRCSFRWRHYCVKAYEPILAKPNDNDTPKHPKSLDLKILLEWLTIFSVKVGCCNDHIFNFVVKFSRQRIAQCWGSFLLPTPDGRK